MVIAKGGFNFFVIFSLSFRMMIAIGVHLCLVVRLINDVVSGAEDGDDAPDLKEEGTRAQHRHLPQRDLEEQVQAGAAGRSERHQATRGWRLFMKSNATVLLLSTTVYPALIAAVVVSIEPRSSVT